MKKRIYIIAVFVLLLLKLNIISFAKEGNIKLVDINKLENFSEYVLTDDLNSDVLAEDTASENNPELSYGSVADYLTKQDDYIMYPFSLKAGEYLQAELQIPFDANIDYDLMIFDSDINLIKYSRYVTCIYNEKTIDESIGYCANEDETIYLCVYSSMGGSETEQFILRYSAISNCSEILSDEPNENANEAIKISTESSICEVNGNINSPVDNDWYILEVTDSPSNYKVRLSLATLKSSDNCVVDIYRNLLNDEYAMLKIYSGLETELELSAGTYYIRVRNENPENFTNITEYSLGIAYVARVDGITNMKFYSEKGGAQKVNYSQGQYYRVDSKQSNSVTVSGQAFYLNEKKEKIPSANAKIDVCIEDPQWLEHGREDLAYLQGSAYTDQNGLYSINFTLNKPYGGLSTYVTISTHYYDLMKTTATLHGNKEVFDMGYFYYLKKSVR